jgi:hypothetical protein
MIAIMLAKQKLTTIHGLFAVTLFLFCCSAYASSLSVDSGQEKSTQYYLIKTISALREEPDGRIAGIWDKGSHIASDTARGDWLKVTRRFENGRWHTLKKELWISKFYVSRERGRATPKSSRPEGLSRYIRIDKSDFSLQVVERHGKQEKIIYTTQVALGMDRCLPEAKGGRCYFTPPGNYQIKSKFANSNGIEWCIPKSMEQEFPEHVLENRRCFRGPFGNHALNIGGSYAIHGTNRPDLIGRKVSHGCIRAPNRDMAKIYRMMEIGDRVLITN